MKVAYEAKEYILKAIGTTDTIHQKYSLSWS